MIILVLVALLWMAVVIPGILSKVSERRSSHSIDRFHQRLDLLERTGPKLVAPAYRLIAPAGAETTTTSVPTIVPTAPPPVRPSLVLLQPGDGRAEAVPVTPVSPAPVVHLRTASSHRPGDMPSGRPGRDRSLARRRRRHTFVSLSALCAFSGALGLVHSLRAAWIVSGMLFALLGAYIALAVGLQRVEADHRQFRARSTASISHLPISFDDELIEDVG
jgi:hypothetical protein